MAWNYPIGDKDKRIKQRDDGSIDTNNDSLESLVSEVKNEVVKIKEEIQVENVGGSVNITTSSTMNPIKIKNASRSWWVSPLAIHTNQLYFTWIASNGSHWVASYDEDTKELKQRMLAHHDEYIPDDHNPPCVMSRRDLKLMCFYTGHDNDNYVRYRVSKNPGSIDEMEDEQKIEFSGSCTYAQAYRYARNVFLLTRVGGGHTGKWVFIVSEDEGETWSDEQVLFQEPWRYITTKQTALGFHCCVGTHPRNSNVERIGVFTANMQNHIMGFIRDDGSYSGEIFARFSGENLPIEWDDMNDVYIPPEGSSTRLYDTHENNVIVFSEFDAETTDYEDSMYKMALKQSDGSYLIKDIVNSGRAFWLHYFGGVSISDKSSKGNTDKIILHISRHENDHWYVEEWITENQGETWETEELTKVYDPSDTEMGSLMYKVAIRPTTVMWSDKIDVMWLEGTYLAMHRYDNTIKAKKIED